MTIETIEEKTRPCGHLILVEIEPLPEDLKQEKVSKGGIVIRAALSEHEINRHEDGRQIGKLVAVGFQAWKAFGDGTPWANIGDRIYFKRYAGIEFRDSEDKLYRVMNDDDMWLVLAPTAGVKQYV